MGVCGKRVDIGISPKVSKADAVSFLLCRTNNNKKRNDTESALWFWIWYEVRETRTWRTHIDVWCVSIEYPIFIHSCFPGIALIQLYEFPRNRFDGAHIKCSTCTWNISICLPRRCRRDSELFPIGGILPFFFLFASTTHALNDLATRKTNLRHLNRMCIQWHRHICRCRCDSSSCMWHIGDERKRLYIIRWKLSMSTQTCKVQRQRHIILNKWVRERAKHYRMIAEANVCNFI